MAQAYRPEQPNSPEQMDHSAIFVLNVREEKLHDGRIEWRGEVLDVYGNTVNTFEDWPDLIDLIAGALDNLPAAGQGLPHWNSGSLEARLSGLE